MTFEWVCALTMTADGSAIQEIEYLYELESFRPLAQVTHKANQASQLHYIVTDHAGTPQPHSWMGLTSKVNTSLGGQAGGYPIGYKPTKFILRNST